MSDSRPNSPRSVLASLILLASRLSFASGWVGPAPFGPSSSRRSTPPKLQPAAPS